MNLFVADLQQYSYDDLINEKRFPKTITKVQPIQSDGLPTEPLQSDNPNGPNYIPKLKKEDGGSTEQYVPDYMAFGGYMPNDYYAYGGYMPEAAGGLNVSPVSFDGNPVIGLGNSPTWDAMSSFNNQNKDIKGPIDTNKYYNERPLDNDCTDQDKLDPKSDCYDPQNAQLKIKEEKSGTINYDNIARGYNTVANLGADSIDYYNENRTKLIPGKVNFAYGEKEKATEIANRGPFDARTGRDAISGFEGVIKKGGSIGHKKGGEYSLTMQEIRDLIRDGGLVEFLD